MINIIDFIHRLLPDLRAEGPVFYPDDNHRFSVATIGANIRFIYESRIAGSWVPMGDVEIDPGPDFWERVVQVLRLYARATFTLPDRAVAAVADSLPGADLLTQEVAGPRHGLPKPREPRAGGINPDFTGTIRSRGGAKKRPPEDPTCRATASN